MKKTDWFPGSVRPVHIGVYQRLLFSGVEGRSHTYSYWDGDCWFSYCRSAEEAVNSFKYGCISSHQADDQPVEFKWRGLAEDPASRK